MLDHLQLEERGDTADTPVWAEALDGSAANVIKTKDELKAASLNKLIELLTPEGSSAAPRFGCVCVCECVCVSLPV